MKSVLIKICIGAASIFIITIGLMITKNIKEADALKAEAEIGRTLLGQMETVSVAEVEHKIRQMAAEEAAKDEENNIPLNERYTRANAMVIGDSEALALSVYNILSEASVAAKVAQHVKDCDEQIEKAISKNSAVVFMTYGINDLGIYGSGVQFAEDYGVKLERLKAGLPNGKIYVTSIFPSTEEAIQKRPYLNYKNLEDFNSELKKKAEALGMTFIDCNILVKDEYYEPDGQHFKYEMYVQWAELLADTAGL